MNEREVMPSLDLLVGFEAAARHLSFTKAGEELYLTQSAVSRQIKELEGQLGVPLFERRHRALSLTEAGQHFYAAAAQVITTMRGSLALMPETQWSVNDVEASARSRTDASTAYAITGL